MGLLGPLTSIEKRKTNDTNIYIFIVELSDWMRLHVITRGYLLDDYLEHS